MLRRHLLRLALLGTSLLCHCAPPADSEPPPEPQIGDPGLPGDPPGLPAPGPGARLTVHLVPQAGVTGAQRVNFAVPLARGQLKDGAQVIVAMGDKELAAGRRVLARHPDGSVRSVQLQVELTLSALSGQADLEVRLGETPKAAALPLQPVEGGLLTGNRGPRVWALLPARWLAQSGVGGPQVAEADLAGTPLDAWRKVCDYDRFNADAFQALAADPAVWLFDRGTALYRGYARRGDLSTLQSAYRETSLYRDGITGAGPATRIGVPGKADDLKYHYAQNLALHYLLTGDDRFRESAEAVAARAAALWPDPGYAGGADFWTERHAGFGLLAYVAAMTVSDDRAAEFQKKADEAAAAYLAVQATYPRGYADAEARCFAHSAEAHDEDFGYFGCSPWMSAIVADALDAYATERGGAEASAVRSSLVRLGRSLARHGRDPQGRPYYWMGVGVDRNEADDYDEHWGESAYVIAMAYQHQGRTDPALQRAAGELIKGLATVGVSPHIRSFNWQCRSAPGAAAFLR